MSDASVVRAGETLLTGRGAQLSLLGEVDEAGLPAAAYTRIEERGRFTGERLFSSNPKLYGAIAKLLARGQMGYREIADVCEVSVNTVCGVAFREGLPIETIRERLGRVGLDVARLTLEAMLELLSDPESRKKIPAKDLAVMHGIAVSNAQLLLGGATARIESSQPASPGHADYLAFLRNVTPTGLSAGNPGANSGAPGAPDGPAMTLPASVPSADPDASKPSAGDNQSPDS